MLRFSVSPDDLNPLRADILESDALSGNIPTTVKIAAVFILDVEDLGIGKYPVFGPIAPETPTSLGATLYPTILDSYRFQGRR